MVMGSRSTWLARSSTCSARAVISATSAALAISVRPLAQHSLETELGVDFFQFLDQLFPTLSFSEPISLVSSLLSLVSAIVLAADFHFLQLAQESAAAC